MDTVKEFLRANAWVVLVVAGVAVVLYQFVDPAPPRELTIATGSEEGRYYQVGMLLKEGLAENGITLNVVSTAGSGENIRLLNDPDSEVAIALVQSGMEHVLDSEQENLFGLASLYYEPIWLFYRKHLALKKITDLKGLRLIIGEPGSGTELIARHLLQDNGMLADASAEGAEPVTLMSIGGDEAVAQLKSGGADAAMFTVSAQSALIAELIHMPDIDFLDVKRAAAYTARYPFLASVTVSEGLLDLKNNIPDAPRTTFASTALLLVNEKFHPSFTPLVLEILSRHLKKGGILEKPHEFPSADKIGFSLTKEAEHYFESGPPYLNRYLPFWAASLADRLVIFIVPLLVILIPLIKIAGPLYRWRIRSRIYRWYRYLLETDRKIAEGKVTDPETEKTQISELEGEIDSVDVPLSYADELYMLKQHVEYIKRRLDTLISEQA